MPPKASRSWWRNQFYDHPGWSEKREDAYVTASVGSTKAEKVYCIPCFDANVTEIITRDEVDLRLGRRNNVRSSKEITMHRTSHFSSGGRLTDNHQVWSIQRGHEPPPDKTYGFLRYASSTLINHVKTCSRQDPANRAHAKHEKVSPKKPNTSSSIHPTVQPLRLPRNPDAFQQSPPYHQMLLPSLPST